MPIHELGLPDNGDLIMGGPFGEPYDKYLRCSLPFCTTVLDNRLLEFLQEIWIVKKPDELCGCVV